MTCDEFKDQLVQYSMGTLEASQRAELLSHLQSGCADCNSFLAETREAVTLLPLGLEPIEPPPKARHRLLERIADQSRPMQTGLSKPLPRRVGIFQALIGGAIAAGIMAAIFWQVETHRRQEIASLQAQLDDTRATLEQLKASVQRTRENLRQTSETLRLTTERVQMMQSPGVQMVSLQGTEAQPQAKARAYYDSSNSRVEFYATDMRPAAPGKAYELWLIPKTGAPMPAGMFTADKASRGVALAVPSTKEQVVAFAVTQEPALGSATPTMPILVKGAVQ